MVLVVRAIKNTPASRGFRRLLAEAVYATGHKPHEREIEAGTYPGWRGVSSRLRFALTESFEG